MRLNAILRGWLGRGERCSGAAGREGAAAKVAARGTCYGLRKKASSVQSNDPLYKDKLDQKLLQRPKPEELVKSGILKRKYSPTVAGPFAKTDYPTSPLQRTKLLSALSAST
jgi:hypothetical protein